MFRDDCYKFSSLRFDEGLTFGRLKVQEVDEVIEKLHEGEDPYS